MPRGRPRKIVEEGSETNVVDLHGQVPTNGGEETILSEEPYTASVTIHGDAAYLYHGWNVEAVEAKARAAKGSEAKKTDDLESYVYRDKNGYLSIPGEQLRMALVNAGRYRQDPRSPRKSSMDLFKAGIVVVTEQATIGPKPLRSWDMVDRRRVVIQRNAITRSRPCIFPGWEATFDLQILLPGYISPDILNWAIRTAGQFCCVGNFRPTYGRFHITNFTVTPFA